MSAAIAADTTNGQPQTVKPVTGDDTLIEAAARYRAATRAEDRADAVINRLLAGAGFISGGERDANDAAFKRLDGNADYEAARERSTRAYARASEAQCVISETQPSGLHGVMIQMEHVHLCNTKDGTWSDWFILQPMCLAFKAMSDLTGITSRECLGVFARCKKDGEQCFCRDRKG